MKTKKQFAANATDNGGETVPTPKTRKVNLIPTKDADFLTVAKSVNTKWAATPALSLMWITQSGYATIVGSYDTNLNARLAVGSGRSTQTQTLRQVNKVINEAVKDVKIYILKKFKKANAEAQYGRYGIVYESKTFVLPKDNDKRLLALPLMQAAIAADGFGSEEFGTSFWTNTITSFSAALAASGNTAKGISNKVAAKDTDREKVEKVLNAIIHLLQANYPDNTDKVLREWGFIKQNY
jgi:hypothetical protein